MTDTIKQSTRLFGRRFKSSRVEPQASMGLTKDPAQFASNGIADVNNGALFANQSGIELLGEATSYWDIATAGNVSLIFTVPTGKYWRLLSATVVIEADSNVANRIAVSETRTVANAEIDTITDGVAVTADQTKARFFLYDMAVNTRGAARVQAKATMTVADDVTDDDDTWTLGGGTDTHSVEATFMVVAALSTDGTQNEILHGADEAAFKVNMNLAFGASRASPTATTHSVSDDTYNKLGMTAADFTGGGANDNMVFTATEPGIVGHNLVCTETFTSGNNVFDAGVFGTTTAGVDAVLNHAGVEWPAAGALLTPGQDVEFNLTAGVAGDNFIVALTVLEYDSDPT